MDTSWFNEDQQAAYERLTHMNILVCNSCNEPMRHDGSEGNWWLRVLCECGSRMFVTVDLPAMLVPENSVTFERIRDEVEPFTDTD